MPKSTANNQGRKKTKTSANARKLEKIEGMLDEVSENSPHETDGKWLEDVILRAAPLMEDWDIKKCWLWKDWPERDEHYPETAKQDIGIDLVGVRASDGKHIAIQSKSAKLDEHGSGSPLAKDAIDSFGGASADSLWAERWLITNGDVPLGRAARQQASTYKDKPLKQINLDLELQRERKHLSEPTEDVCEQTDSNQYPPQIQSRDCMQREAVDQSVKRLREHAAKNENGRARGKIILPCGTGKTRISLRIIEELTPKGGVAVVLCPSIALVAQLRREYLQHWQTPINAMAVCSDKTAGYDPTKEDDEKRALDPTADTSNVSAKEIKGRVTTDPKEIAEWIEERMTSDGLGSEAINIIFGTYQSGRQIAKALSAKSLEGVEVSVLVADEAHRTAGLSTSAKNADQKKAQKKKMREFALCHDDKHFPAKFRVYQTATPRILNFENKQKTNSNGEVIVRSMDDQDIFGIELYRKSYMEAVANGWLSDYRIIGIGINDPAAFDLADELAREQPEKERNVPNSANFRRALAFALAMSGGVKSSSGEKLSLSIKSCIAFLNTVKKSSALSRALQTQPVKDWLTEWFAKHSPKSAPKDYQLQHVDAHSNVTKRDQAKAALEKATTNKQTPPQGVLNVGIFGEGTDSPNLSAVAFLEPRKSPVDVVQAVGRVMRIAPDKELGYILVPIVFPPGVHPEWWLAGSSHQDWEEMGQILLALSAHDSRIEDNLAELFRIVMPGEPKTIEMVLVAPDENDKAQFFLHVSNLPNADEDLHKYLESGAKPRRMKPIDIDVVDKADLFSFHQMLVAQRKGEEIEVRVGQVPRNPKKAKQDYGDVDIKKLKKRATNMFNRKEGKIIPRTIKKKTYDEQVAFALENLQHSHAIQLNLLENSGLASDRRERDMNVLEGVIAEASRYMAEDDLKSALDRHFGLDNLKENPDSADGITIASLLMMNAAMLHQRIAKGKWLNGVKTLEDIQGGTGIIEAIKTQWNIIARRDFLPVIEPALEVIDRICEEGKKMGLEKALEHITKEATYIAEFYAEMGADHAGPLFNRVMGNQKSDGAFFTRPTAGSLLARLALDAATEYNSADWASDETWKDLKTVDLACGSGTLLAAVLADMKQRAKQQGASKTRLSELHKLGVEDTIKGLDVNPISLQLAATRLTASNRDVKFKRMGLHQMPYGPSALDDSKVSAGTLELLGQSKIMGTPRLTKDENIVSESVSMEATEDIELEEVVEAAGNTRLVIINPPFTNRSDMGGKFTDKIQCALRERTDVLRKVLIATDSEMAKFGDTNSIEPLFLALADKCLSEKEGVLAVVNPTIALSAPSAAEKLKILASRFHIQTILTCHDPQDPNLSESTINESLIVAQRKNHRNSKLPTRIIALDRFPHKETDVDELHRSIIKCNKGMLGKGWGEVSWWSADRIELGDWTAGIWRHPDVADAVYRFAHDKHMKTMEEQGLFPRRTDLEKSKGYYKATKDAKNVFPVIFSKGLAGQLYIQAKPDVYFERRAKIIQKTRLTDNETLDVPLLQKASYLLVSAGQNAKSARLTAVASEERYIGGGWMPVQITSHTASKAIAVFYNSTPGRLQLMGNAGETLGYPTYNPAAHYPVRVPNIADKHAVDILSACWEATKNMEVPEFGDGECEVRRLWDEAVAEAMGWDPAELERLRLLLHKEPHVCGSRYGAISV